MRMRTRARRLVLMSGATALAVVAAMGAGPGTASAGVAIPPHDFNGDGHADLLALTSTGDLYLYPGNGSGHFLARSKIGTGWNGPTALAPANGDWDGDGSPDMLAKLPGGTLAYYKGNGTGFSTPATAISEPGTWKSASFIPPGDFTGDGNIDIIQRDAGGHLLLFTGDGHGNLSTASTVIGAGWGSLKIYTPGDWDGDGHADLLTRTTGGELDLWRGNGAGGFIGGRKAIGSGWSAYKIVTPGDWNGDGHVDLLARASNGILYLYPGNGTGGFGTRVAIGTGWGGFANLF